MAVDSSFFSLLGTGSSASVPWLHCVISPATSCETCKEALSNPVRKCVFDSPQYNSCQQCLPALQGSKNRRNNPSAVLSHVNRDGRRVNIMIDCGKTFRDTVVKSFPPLGIDHLDAVLLTHGHADAFMGLDDLRDVSLSKPLSVYTSRPCFDVVARAFSYLVTKPTTKGLHVATLNWHIIEPWVPFEVEGVIVLPIPLVHGPPEPMLGFEFSSIAPPAPVRPLEAARGFPTSESPASSASGGMLASPIGTISTASASPIITPGGLTSPSGPGHRIVYLSDLVALPADVRAYLLSRPISLLVLDALSYSPYPYVGTVGALFETASSFVLCFLSFAALISHFGSPSPVH